MRADLAGLDAAALSLLANPGLVKRAARDLAEGQGPELEEDEQATVTGRFPDGSVARLPAGRPLREGSCTCGAVSLCRHRVAVALAYRAWADSRPEVSLPDWSPGSVTEEELLARIGPGAVKNANRRARSGLEAELQPGRPWVVKLPTATVRFLVPGELAHLRCDCADSPVCEHVVLAVWACRLAPGATRSTRVRLSAPPDVSGPAEAANPAGISGPAEATAPPAVSGPVGAMDPATGPAEATPAAVSGPDETMTPAASAAAASSASPGSSVQPAGTGADLVGPPVREGLRGLPASRAALNEAVQVVQALARVGVSQADPGLVARLGRAAREPARQGMLWPVSLLERLQEQVERYREHSALYDRDPCCWLAVSLLARARAAGELPERWLLGQDVRAETALGHLDLTALGCRLAAGPESRSARVYLADPAGQVLVWEKALPGEGEAGSVRVLPGCSLRQLSGSILSTRSARRRADRSLTLGRGPLSLTSLEQPWEGLPEGLRVDSATGWAAHNQVPRVLRPPVQAEDVHVLELGEVEELAYAPGEQSLRARCRLRDGSPVEVVRTYQVHLPQVLEVLAAHLPRAGRVSGQLSRVGGRLRVDPFALEVGGRRVLLDLEPPPEPAPRLEELPLWEPEEEAGDPLRAAVEEGWTRCCTALHQGLDHLEPFWRRSCQALVTRLEELGLLRLAAAYGRLADREGWFEAALLTELCRGEGLPGEGLNLDQHEPE